MESEKLKLARQSAGYGIDPSALVSLLDLVTAIGHVITQAPGLNRHQVNQWQNLLRKSVFAICRALGGNITAENLLIQGLIDRSAEIRDKLGETYSAREADHHRNHLRLLLAFARGMGFQHKLFDAEREWEALPFFKKDSAAQMVITDLSDSMVRPQDVTQQHLNNLYIQRRDEGYFIPTVKQAIGQLKFQIRETHHGDKFPLLDVSSARPAPLRLADEDKDPDLQHEVEEILAWFADQYAAGNLFCNEITRRNLAQRIECLIGFATRWLPLVGSITRLSQVAKPQVIRACTVWLDCTGRMKADGIKAFLYGLHSLLSQHPSFADRNWDWILGQIAKIKPEPESAIEARRQQRANDYNYDAIDDLLRQMEERRESDGSRSEVETGWMLHNEYLMEVLAGYPLPPRCIRECRINGDSPNLFRASEYPHRVSDILARTKNPFLISDDMWVIRFSAEEVPHRTAIEGPLLDQLIPGLIRYLEYRKLLIQKRGDPGTLFFNRNGGTLTASKFSYLVGDITEYYLDDRIPPSAFRDIAAYRLLAWRHEDWSTLTSLLGQSEHSVRMRFDREYRLAHRAHPHYKGHSA